MNNHKSIIVKTPILSVGGQVENRAISRREFARKVSLHCRGSDQFDMQKVPVKDIEGDGGTVSLKLENLKLGYIYELTMGDEEGEVLENSWFVIR